MENIEAKESISREKSSEDDLKKRKERISKFLKEKKEWVFYSILAVIAFVGLYIRTRNIPKLKDITTGTWTLAPDLDPFLFLRWAKYIAEHGKLFVFDAMRYVPLIEFCSGAECNPINTSGEMKLLSYMIVWLYRFLSFFKETSVTYAAIIFPVVMFGLTTIAFFIFARKVFYKKDDKTRNIIALVSTGFFVLVPSLIHRTIAGIPEKESASFFFVFLIFYCILESFTLDKLKKSMIFGFSAGILTGILGLLWGGVTYIFAIIPITFLFVFIIGKIENKNFYSYALWVFGFLIVMLPFSTRYTLSSLIASSSSGMAFMVLFILSIDFLIFKKKMFRLNEKIKMKLPQPIISLIISFIAIIFLASLFFGISFIPSIVKDVIQHTVYPFVPSRFGVTVAENRLPYFASDWRGEFGPIVLNIPLYFWLFFTGSVVLFSQLIRKLKKKEKGILILAYIAFLMGLSFSRYSPSSVLNGENSLSLFVYFGGALLFLGTFGYFYYKRYKENEFSVFKEFEFSYILYFIILTMTIIGARGAVRLTMVLAAVTPVAVGFLVVSVSERYLKEKDETKKFFIGIFLALIVLSSVFTMFTYYRNNKSMAENYAPGIYQWQWQKAMAWVRENTPSDAVFAHWWDYGYWVQSIGERATILDGGNAIGYWNHFMGRYVLTGSDERKALEFLYAHKGTHLLIDSTEIGKYTAFSSIGSDGDYDRYSWISTFLKDNRQTQETNNITAYVYQGGTYLDEDILWKEGEKNILLPAGRAVVGAIILRKSVSEEFLQPQGIFLYNGNQYTIPLNYIYINGTFIEFDSGINAGIFVFPKLDPSEGRGLSMDSTGALLYLSGRTINSGISRLYLMNRESDYFKLVHSEDDILIQDIRSQGFNIEEFIYYQGIRGPIKIWEINYPLDIELDEEYLSLDYPLEFQTVRGGF